MQGHSLDLNIAQYIGITSDFSVFNDALHSFLVFDSW